MNDYAKIMGEHCLCHDLSRSEILSYAGAASDHDWQSEQERRWAGLDASVPCSHVIPGTCDYCGGS